MHCKLNCHVRGLKIGATMDTIRDISKFSFGITSYSKYVQVICHGSRKGKSQWFGGAKFNEYVTFVSTLRFLGSLFHGLQTFEEEYDVKSAKHQYLTHLTCKSVIHGNICVVNCGRLF
jgi:hypothetical protein